MKYFLKIYSPNELMTYIVKRVVCKTVWHKKVNCLFVEIESTDDLDHVDEDALQNKFPKIVLTLEDYPINQNSLHELMDQSLIVTNSSEEIVNEDGETEEIIYTNLSVDNLDYETVENELTFYKSDKNVPTLGWRGKCKDYINQTDAYFRFDLRVPIAYEI